MKNILILFALLSLILGTVGCTKEQKKNDANLTLVFRAHYDGQPLWWKKSLDYHDDITLEMDKIDFFLSNFYLLGPNQTQTKVLEVAYVEILDRQVDEASAQAGFEITLNNVPEGEYLGFGFHYGLSEDQNNQRPSDFSSNNPLGRASLYWDAWDGYIFSKFEGRFSNTSGITDRGFALHTGSLKDGSLTPAHTLFTAASPLFAKSGETLEIRLDIDAKKLFNQPEGKHVDLVTQNQSHSFTDAPFMISLLANLPLATEYLKK
jgi:hypothetical protein